MIKKYKEIKVEYFPESKRGTPIAISFVEGRSGTDVKWLDIEEGKKLLQDLQDVVAQTITKK
jgi:uncharacterized spore protein YtfJ